MQLAKTGCGEATLSFFPLPCQTKRLAHVLGNNVCGLCPRQLLKTMVSMSRDPSYSNIISELRPPRYCYQLVLSYVRCLATIIITGNNLAFSSVRWPTNIASAGNHFLFSSVRWLTNVSFNFNCNFNFNFNFKATTSTLPCQSTSTSTSCNQHQPASPKCNQLLPTLANSTPTSFNFDKLQRYATMRGRFA